MTERPTLRLKHGITLHYEPAQPQLTITLDTAKAFDYLANLNDDDYAVIDDWLAQQSAHEHQPDLHPAPSTPSDP